MLVEGGVRSCGVDGANTRGRGAPIVDSAVVLDLGHHAPLTVKVAAGFCQHPRGGVGVGVLKGVEHTLVADAA